MSIQVITQNGKRRYRWEFDRIIEGERVRKTKMLPLGTTRADADAIARKWDGEVLALAVGATTSEPTIGECVRKHITDRNIQWKDRTKRIGLLEKWREEYDNVSVAELHDWSVQLVGYMRARADRKGMPKRPLTDASIRNFLAYIRAAIRYCHKIGLVEIDLTRRLAIPSVSNERHNYPDRRQMLRIARACQHRQMRAMIRIAFYSGMRQAEILRAVATKNGYSLATTKNGKPRIVPIHPRVAVLARRFKFSLTSGEMKYWWGAAREKAGYPGTRFHDLRHAAASEMINAGVDLFTVGGVLGHVSLVSTKRYSHLVTDRLSDAIYRIGKGK